GAHLAPDALDLGVLRVAIGVDQRHATAGQDVVELVEQDELPAGVEAGLLAARAQRAGPGAQPPRPPGEQVGAPVGLLGAALAGVGAAVILQVQLAGPGRQVRIVPDSLVQPVEELIDTTGAQPREARQLAKRPRGLEHALGRPAAAVAPAV